MSEKIGSERVMQKVGMTLEGTIRKGMTGSTFVFYFKRRIRT
ncbi:hypothetical protein [Priestia koreensis]|nr:hypothetical protein [Priestia koreensis]